MKNYGLFLSAFLAISLSLFSTSESCTAFYCANSCGAKIPGASPKNAFKLIVAVNRDEQVDRPTLVAGVWPAKNPSSSSSRIDRVECDQSKMQPPYNLCVYGALDTANDSPPKYYSTWLGINERGSVGNLLFYMQNINRTTTKGRGIIASDFLIDSSWPNTDAYMQHLMTTRYDFGPFNYIQAEMSNLTGRYSIYHITNGKDIPYQKVASDSGFGPNYFAVSNSDLDRPFNKVVNGKKSFQEAIENYANHETKGVLLNDILKIMQSTTEHYPDDTLAEFMRKEKDDPAVRGVSRINGNYFGYWSKGHTRTSTIILVDYNNNVEYYEYNLSSFRINESGAVEPGEWVMNSFNFKLKPLNAFNSGARIEARSFILASISIVFYFTIF